MKPRDQGQTLLLAIFATGKVFLNNFMLLLLIALSCGAVAVGPFLVSFPEQFVAQIYVLIRV